MKADTLKVKEIFNKDIRYVVPLFQRPYVWNEEDQWEPLWDDVVAVAERLLDALGRLDGQDSNGAVQAEEGTPPHFLGAVVVDQIPGVVADIKAHHVIDGQQRLTTLQLLLSAVQGVTAELGDTRSARLLGKLVRNDEDVFSEPDHVFKVWPSRPDHEAFRAALDGSMTVSSDSADSPIIQAHEFFTTAARDWVCEASGEDQMARLSALSSTLQGLLQLVVIDLEPHDNAQVIFETLNARGTPLLVSDLVKNLLIHTAVEQRLDVEDLYSRYWRQFDERDYWRAQIRQGRFVRPRLDVFLHYWLMMRSGQDVPSQQMFPVFQRYFRDQSYDVDALLADLHRCGDAFRRLDEIPDATVDGTFVYRWRTLDAQAVTPVVLWLFDQLSETDRQEPLLALESWLVRRSLLRLTTNSYSRITLDMLRELEQTTGERGTVLQRFFARQESYGAFWPTDDQIVEAFQAPSTYRRMTKPRVRMVLEALEDSYRGSKSETQHIERGSLTIEHVLPQRWRQNWPMARPDGETEEDAADRRDRLLHGLGNLTLVTRSLNPALSNSDWPTKRNELERHSVLHLNKRLLEMGKTDWNESTIEQRGRQLAAQAIQIWPGPNR